MIKARNSSVAEIIFKPYIQWIFKRHFREFFSLLSDLGNVESKGIIITPNHFSWWDGFFAYLFIKKHFPNRQIKMMMLEEQLKRFWFFKYLGCFSINPKNPKCVVESLQYASKQVSEHTVLVIYPQGAIKHFYTQYTAKNGLGFIIERTTIETLILPVVFSVNYSEHRLPSVYANSSLFLASELKAQGIKKLEKELHRLRESLLVSDFFEKNSKYL